MNSEKTKVIYFSRKDWTGQISLDLLVKIAACRTNYLPVIASEAKQSRAAQRLWIASSPSAPRNDEGTQGG
ncbi:MULTISPECIES: hypothetical protein [unclassified Bradyrhizobium]|uniref:hypothetical protein n=1 Tax=unclassified Bradyrhizobium TaxID=2631580 RepID=UPI0024E16DC8|nr:MULTISPECIES: hypothetical protein [unclassified Bradyrhizobium]